MSAPTPVVRQTPVGEKLKDGYQSLIAFAADPDISIWEKTVQPPGLDGGDPVDNTTMHNTSLRTSAPRGLKTMTNSQMTVAYDPQCLLQLLALINVETTITVAFPDGSAWSFYGFLQSFEPAENEEGTQPEATCVIVPTNTDPTTGEEEEPIYTAELGTGTA